MTSSLSSISLLEQLPELRETLTFTSLLKDGRKDTSQQADEEMHRARSGEGQECSRPLQVRHSPHISMFTSPEALQTQSFGFLGRLHYIVMLTKSLTILPFSLQPLSPPGREADGTESSKPNHMIDSPGNQPPHH